MEDLKNRLIEYHEMEGISYKQVAKELGISLNIMYNYTADVRDLKPHVKLALDKYLTEKGY